MLRYRFIVKYDHINITNISTKSFNWEIRNTLLQNNPYVVPRLSTYITYQTYSRRQNWGNKAKGIYGFLTSTFINIVSMHKNIWCCCSYNVSNYSCIVALQAHPNVIPCEGRKLFWLLVQWLGLSVKIVYTRGHSKERYRKLSMTGSL